MPSVINYTLVVMSSIERYIDTDVTSQPCEVAVMSNMVGEMSGIVVVLS